MDPRLKRKKIIEGVARVFTPYTDGILIEGSGAWGEAEKTGDLDLEFIAPGFDFFESLDFKTAPTGELIKVVKDFTKKTLRQVLALDLKMFSFKIFPSGRGISFRFMKTSLFNQVCHLDFVDVRETKSVFQYRLHPTKPFHLQRNFSGERLKYHRWHFSFGEEQLIESPIVIIDPKGRFYPGEIIDRYLAFPKLFHQKDAFCRKSLKELRVGIVKRLVMEERQGLHQTRPALRRCLSRGTRIPEELLTQLDEEEAEIRFQISKGGNDYE